MTVATWKPALLRVERAVDTDSPITEGTVAVCLPLETVSVTRVPTGTLVNAGGDMEITWCWGMLSLGAIVTATLRPRERNSRLAAICPASTTLGICTVGGPLETTSVTVLPELTFDRARGSV